MVFARSIAKAAKLRLPAYPLPRRLIIAEDAASFFFPAGTSWTSHGHQAQDDNVFRPGIDVVLVAMMNAASCWTLVRSRSGVYLGQSPNPFYYYMQNQTAALEWSGPNYPRADYLGSSRKWLTQQLRYKGGIFKQRHKSSSRFAQGLCHFAGTASSRATKTTLRRFWPVWNGSNKPFHRRGIGLSYSL
jgi:hypothetical protein